MAQNSEIDVGALMAQRLVGRHLIAVERREHDWAFSFEGDVGISAGCPWRILVEGAIAHGYGDDAQKFGLPTPIDGAARSIELLRDKIIESVTIRHGPGDLAISFNGRTVLEILNLSSGYEGWQFGDSTGFSVIAMGGGELAIWNR